MKLIQIGEKKLYCLEKGDRKLYFSYEVPIAYVVDDVAHMTSQRFTPTTSKHKSLITNELERGKLNIEEDRNLFNQMVSLYF